MIPKRVKIVDEPRCHVMSLCTLVEAAPHDLFYPVSQEGVFLGNDRIKKQKLIEGEYVLGWGGRWGGGGKHMGRATQYYNINRPLFQVMFKHFFM